MKFPIDVMIGKEKQKPALVSVWKNNNVSKTLLITIPEPFVKKYEIKPQEKLLVTDTPQGILLRQVNLADLIQED